MSDYRRQHPIMILTNFLAQLRSWLLPIVFIVLLQTQFGQRGDFNIGTFIFPLAVVLLAPIYSSIQWFFYRYKLSDNALNIRSGIIIKKRRYIKKERVQTTNLEAGVILRIFNLTSLRVETAGSKSEAEAYLAALSKADANRIQTYLSQTEGEEETSVEEQREKVLSVPFNTLFLAGVTSGGIGVVFSIVGVFFSQAFVFLPDTVLDRLYDSVLAMSFLFIALLVAVIFLISWVISIIRYIIRFAFFTIETTQDEIIITRGLIVQKTFRLKAHRIQAISIIEGLFREPFNLATIECNVAGGSAYEPQYKVTLMPLLKRNEIQAFLHKLTPQYNVTFKLEPLPKRALRRYLVRALLPFLLLSPLYFFFVWTLWLLTALPISFYLGYLRYKNGGLYHDEDTMVLRTRVLAKQTNIALKKHIQAIEHRQNPLQRLRSLSSFNFTVLSSPSHQTFVLKDMELSNLHILQTWFHRHQ